MLTKLTQLKNRPGFLRYLQNTSWMMGEKILRMFVGLFVGIWIARYLGPEQFGLLSYAQSFVGLFTAVATLGLDSVVVRELVKDPTKHDKLMGTTFGLKLIGALLILPILALAIKLTSNDSFTNLLIFIIASATIFQSFNVIDFYYQANVQSKYVALANTISLSLSSIIKIVLLLNQAPLIDFACMVIFDSAVLAIGLIYYYKKNSQLKLLNWQFDTHVAQGLIKDSWPLILAGLSFTLFSSVDVIMLKEMAGAATVGEYSAAYKLTTLWYFLPGLILNSSMPAVISAINNQKKYYARILLITSCLVWFAIAMALLVSFLSEALIKMTYGINYNSSASILTILIWVNVLIFFNSAWNNWQVAEGKSKYVLYFHFMTAVLSIILNFVLIPEYGALGASYAIVASLLTSLLFMSLIDKGTIFLIFDVLLLSILHFDYENKK